MIPVVLVTRNRLANMPSSLTQLLKDKLKALPAGPGVYLFRNVRGKVIYIGKAKSLKNRVRSYFRSSASGDTKTAVMVSQVTDFELVVTDTEIEALILEANLVRQHKPRYNIHLKDDKHYPYIKVTTYEDFPRALIVRRILKDGASYFGPYTSAAGMRKSLKFICKLFKIRTCDLEIPHPRGKPYKVCLDYQIGRCGGPCEDLQSKEEYRESVEAVMLFLSGRGRRLIDDLQEKMDHAAGVRDFERAAELRDQIRDLRRVVERQKVDVAEKIDRDVIALAQDDTEREAAAVVLQIRDGVLIGRQDFGLKPGESASKEHVLREFLEQYYNKQPNLPREVFIPFKIDEIELLNEWLSDSASFKVKIITPGRGEKLRLVEMALSNAQLLLDNMLAQKRGYREKVAPMVSALKEALELNHPPNTIACFDVSNTGETDAVGSMSYFKKGKPLKSEYRRFKIKSVVGQDDYAMMREIIGRYFFRRRNEGLSLPDLVVVDGGRGQLNAAVAELASLNIGNQEIVGLAKRLEEIYFPEREEPITISKSSPALSLLKQVRDEAHRFGVSYNRKVRAKRTIRSQLDDIPGVGPNRRSALLKRFGSVKRLAAADIADIAETPGISKTLAETIAKALRGK